jgi:hypothetical protein
MSDIVESQVGFPHFKKPEFLSDRRNALVKRDSLPRGTEVLLARFAPGARTEASPGSLAENGPRKGKAGSIFSEDQVGGCAPGLRRLTESPN